MKHSIVKSDAIEFLKRQKPRSVNLVFGSPPYADARLYLEGGRNVGIARGNLEWVRWMVEVYRAAQTACRGLVAFVVAGRTDNYEWSAGPARLMAALDQAGFNLRNPPIFHRVGIPGSGGPDWLRSDYEWIICTTRPGQLPWSDNTVMGHAPKRKHRRVNQWGHSIDSGATQVLPDKTVISKGKRPSRRVTSGHKNGDLDANNHYDPPVLANPGNVIKKLYTPEEVAAILEAHGAPSSAVRRYEVGGGVMGDRLCHENEAPFPEALCEFFIRSFCPPGGVVLDPFAGSGTALAVAKQLGRIGIGCDIRQSQVELTKRRLRNVKEIVK